MGREEEVAVVLLTELTEEAEEPSLDRWVEVVFEFFERVEVCARVRVLDAGYEVEVGKDEDDGFESRAGAGESDASFVFLVEVDLPGVPVLSSVDSGEVGVPAEDCIQVVEHGALNDRAVSLGVRSEVVDGACCARPVFSDVGTAGQFWLDVAFCAESLVVVPEEGVGCDVRQRIEEAAGDWWINVFDADEDLPVAAWGPRDASADDATLVTPLVRDEAVDVAGADRRADLHADTL